MNDEKQIIDEKVIWGDLPQDMIKRLNKPLGYFIASLQDNNIFSSRKGTKFTIMTTAVNSLKLEVDTIVLGFDLLRKQFIACKVESHLSYSVDYGSNKDLLFADFSEDSPLDLIIDGYPSIIETAQFFELAPIKVISMEQGSMKSGGSLRFAPAVFSPVILPTIEEIDVILGMEDTGIIFGTYAKENELLLFDALDPNKGKLVKPIKIPVDALFRHISINGKTGAGKTLFLKYLISQFYLEDITIFLTDIEGDIVSQLTRSELQPWQKKRIHDLQSDKYLVPKIVDYSKIGIPPGKINVFYPAYVNPLKDPVLLLMKKEGVQPLPFQPSSELIDSWAMLATVLPDLTPAQKRELELFYQQYKNKISGEQSDFNDKLKFTLSGFIKFISGAETRSAGDSTKDIIITKLELLSGKGTLDLDTTDPTDAKKLMEKGKINILYLPQEGDLFNIRTLLQLLAIKLVSQPDVHENDPNFKRAIIIDEAQKIIPRSTSSQDVLSTALYNIFYDIAERGRKQKIALIVASQRPQRLHRGVFSQCNTRIFMTLSIDDIRDLKELVPKEYKSVLPQLKQHWALLHSPDHIQTGSVMIHFPVPPIYHDNVKEGLKDVKESMPKMQTKPTKVIGGLDVD